MPVRKLQKSYRNVTGLFYSNRLRRLVQFDSMLERDFILILDLHPSVRWFAEQPMRIPWVDEAGARQTYVPDFRITFRGGVFLGRQTRRPWLVETKYRGDLLENWERIKPKVRAGFGEAAQRRLTFHIVTETDISGHPLENAKFLRKFVNSDVPPELIRVLLDRLTGGFQTTPAILLGKVSTSDIEKSSLDQALWTAISHGPPRPPVRRSTTG